MSLDFLRQLAAEANLVQQHSQPQPPPPPAQQPLPSLSNLPPRLPTRPLPPIRAPTTSAPQHDDSGALSRTPRAKRRRTEPLPAATRPASPPPLPRPARHPLLPSSAAQPLPSNLVQPGPAALLSFADTPASQRAAATRRTRLLLRRSLEQTPTHTSDDTGADDNGLWDMPLTQDEDDDDGQEGGRGRSGGSGKKGKSKRKKGRDVPERDKPRYLVNTGVIYLQLPRLLEMTRERLLQRDYRSAARCMAVAFRVRRLDNDTVFKCMTQLLSAPSPPTTASAASIYVDMVRFYRRMRVVRPSKPLSFPAIETKNASQLRLELSVLLERQGRVREAAEEMGKALDEGGLAGVAMMEGWTGVLACLLAEEAAQRMEDDQKRKLVTDGDAKQREVDEEEDQDEQPFSLSMSMFVHSQQSYVTAPASASASLLSTHLASLAQHKAAALKHLTTALTAQPASSTWLYYLLHTHCDLHPSDSSPGLALRIAHHFTTVNPLHPVGWRLKLLLLLRYYERMEAAVRWASRQLLGLDTCSVEGLRVVVWEWRAERVASVEVVVRLLKRLDVSGTSDTDAEGEEAAVWDWLHEALHGLLDREMGRDGDGWWYVSAADAEAAVTDSGGEGEWEIETELDELRVREEEEAEEARSQQLSQQFESDLRLGSGGQHKRREDSTRKREVEDTSHPILPISLSVTTRPSAVSPSSSASFPAWTPSLPSFSGGSGSSGVTVAEELRERLEWWMLSVSHMRGVEATSAVDGMCGIDDHGHAEDRVDRVRRCCWGLMHALVEL